MRGLRVALAQVNPIVGDLQGNAALIERFYRRAADAGANLVAFPELAITGYPPEDLLLKPAFIKENRAVLERLAASLTGPVAVIGFVDRDDHLYNAAAVIAQGQIASVYRKVVLPNYGVFDEKRYFMPGQDYPVFDINGVQVGFTICEDAWIGEGPVAAVAQRGAEVIVNINASPYHMDKSFERQVLFRQRARDNKVWFFYVQTVGGQDELVFDGDSLVFDPAGKLMARGSQFEEDVVIVDVELDDEVRDAPHGLIAVRATNAVKPDLPKRRPRIAASPVEEVYGALLLGTRDYVRKNGFSRVTLGLSGGIDSSLTAVIAADAIGPENVVGIAMPSAYSSPASLEDAKELASNLGIEFHVIPIEDIKTAFLDALSDVFAGREEDVTEENLQARIRGTMLMAYSNKFAGTIVLTTGNKSEMATGFTTLYGDSAGGFAVLKDVPKTLVYELSAWRNASGITAIPERVFTKAPTAELRPDQLDTDRLPPYEALDPILRAYVEDDRSIREMIQAGFEESVVRTVVDLVDRSEYKRRQQPPGVKITHRAFGKDWRVPITNRFRQLSPKENQ
jgi:NAD+ synthase (glutamine-hydrolysing)